MMRRILLIVALSLLLAGCVQNQVVCNDPYIMVGDSCCLDKDSNTICDRDENGQGECPEQAFDCNSCPPKIVTEIEEVEILKYLCNDGETVVDDPGFCAEATKEPEPEYDPITTNEDGQSVILEFKVRPACRGGINGVEIFFDVGTAANDVAFQIKSSEDDQFETIFEFSSPVYQKYLYAVFCETDTCTQNTDFFLRPDKKYLFRAKFDMSRTSWKRIFYSNEHIIDHTDDGAYETKLC